MHVEYHNGDAYAINVKDIPKSKSKKNLNLYLIIGSQILALILTKLRHLTGSSVWTAVSFREVIDFYETTNESMLNKNIIREYQFLKEYFLLIFG